VFQGLFERDDAAMTLRSSLDDGESFILSLGCADEPTTVALLRAIQALGSLTLEITSLTS
jgi:hypothetical protein